MKLQMVLKTSDLRGRGKSRKLRDQGLLDVSEVVKTLRESLAIGEKNRLQEKILDLTERISQEVSLETEDSPNYVPLKSDLIQITESQTIERAKYYIKRLIRTLTASKTNGVNDINLYRWKEYDDILTDSLWNFDRRDTSGTHLGWYWGNFVPQIPHQIILRYTKKGDWVLDPFAGSCTTLIECLRLGRNAIGVEINKNTVSRATPLLKKESNGFGVKSILMRGDSTSADFSRLCKRNKVSKVQLVIMHPPYYDIIKFSKERNDLSRADSIQDFLDEFGRVVERTIPVLQDGRYLVLVVGDKYQHGEWIPLGFLTMQRVLKHGYKLTGIITKNFEDTRGKREQKELWRYRALAGGFYVFKHEYVFIFRKRNPKESGADRV